MNSTVMSHPGPRLLAILPHPIPALKVRGLDLLFLTLELEKKVGDDKANLKPESAYLRADFQNTLPRHKSVQVKLR